MLAATRVAPHGWSYEASPTRSHQNSQTQPLEEMTTAELATGLGHLPCPGGRWRRRWATHYHESCVLCFPPGYLWGQLWAWTERGWPPEILLEPGATSREREPKTQPGAAHVLFSSQRQPHLLSHWMTELSLWSPTKYPAPRMTWWCTWPTHTPWAVTSGTTSTGQV